MRGRFPSFFRCSFSQSSVIGVISQAHVITLHACMRVCVRIAAVVNNSSIVGVCVYGSE